AFWQLEKYSEALESYQTTTVLKPDWAEAHFHLGNAFWQLEKYSEALESYQTAIALKPQLLKNFLTRAETIKQQGKLDEAIAFYQHAIIMKPDSADLHLQLGNMLLQIKKNDEACQSYERAIELQPDLIEAYSQRGEALATQGQIDNLVDWYQKSVEIHPKSVELHFKLGNALMLQGKQNEAFRSYYRSNKIKFVEDRSQGNLGRMCFITLAKSASTYIFNALQNLVNNCDNADKPRYLTIFEGNTTYLQLLTEEPYKNSTSNLVSAHLYAEPYNLLTISLIVDRLIVNVRDPRQVTLSQVHHNNLYRYNRSPVHIFNCSQLPKNYFCMSLTEQISWQIDNWALPGAIKWIESWLDAEENPLFYPKILFTRQEDLVENSQELFNTILDFYEIERWRFTMPPPPTFKVGTHYRTGNVDEWRDVFTQEQAEKASSMIPNRLLDRFGWFS
ncbi:tetratricopeptide repeat protein, partial [Microcoleus sp. B13-B6]|uniref:tetratricopeptide repeat protein n=2 Tax=unclassified Microcoleus TaxID=2642155 RepID=UPI002FCE6EBE